MADAYGFGAAAKEVEAQAARQADEARRVADAAAFVEHKRLVAAEASIRQEVLPVLEDAKAQFSSSTVAVRIDVLRTVSSYRPDNYK